MAKQDCSQQLPKLPKGDGTLIYTHGGKILYRKSVPVDDGYKRLSVTGYIIGLMFVYSIMETGLLNYAFLFVFFAGVCVSETSRNAESSSCK